MAAAIATETLAEETQVLAFDVWDTLLDRDATLVPALGDLFRDTGASTTPRCCSAGTWPCTSATR